MPLLVALLALAQVSTFDVASVKPVSPPAGPHVVSLLVNHDKLTIEAAELRQIVGLAYAIQRVRVLRGPDWSDSDQFDIVAKAASPDVTRDEIRAMLQTLLADRFKLAVHRETKESSTYTLVPAKGGPKVKTAAVPDGKMSVADAVSPAGVKQSVCTSSPIRGLVNLLANTIGSPVLDQTGLDGIYDFTFDWPEPGSGLNDSLDRLGLKLELKKAAVEFLVIDHAERPTTN